MTNNISPDDLLVVVAVLDEGGFRAAGKRLGVAASKVSTTVSRVERQLGVPLVTRTTRSVHATDHGRDLIDRVAPLLGEVAAACAAVTNESSRMRGRLKLNVPGAVMPDILPPLLARFGNLYPEVDTEITVENDLVDVVAAGCDAGIRYGNVIEKDMISVPIGPRVQQIALAASPDYLNRRGMPLTPSDLSEHDAIRYRLPSGNLIPWLLRRAADTAEVGPRAKIILGVNAMDAGIAFARDGLGIIATFRNWLEADFAEGSLKPVLPLWWPEIEGPRLYYASRFSPPPLRAFIDLCRELGG